VLTPQLFVDNVKLCDEDVDLGLEFALSTMLDRHDRGTLAQLAPTAAPAGERLKPEPGELERKPERVEKPNKEDKARKAENTEKTEPAGSAGSAAPPAKAGSDEPKRGSDEPNPASNEPNPGSNEPKPGSDQPVTSPEQVDKQLPPAPGSGDKP
jgi:hypothetical protein